MDILKNLKLLIGESINEELAIFNINKVEQFILNYCNISEVPLELEFVWTSLALEYYQIATEERVVNSATEGGRNVTFSNKIPDSIYNIRVQEINNRYTIELNSFRKLYR